ncbi:MAG TPA: hypothetical protein VGP58_13065 [Pyrinomonadaceae bacterium]|jgi:hypothetical protein|nr:hypothetical protein [Pyrinomonadaceae bacterium]
MDITITVSEKAEQKIRRQAAKNGKDVNEFVGEFVEEILEEKFPETIENESKDEEYENPFTPFIGMFSSGKTDTSERMHEILYSEDFDSAEGFSVKK